jgi:hypothetical protein
MHSIGDPGLLVNVLYVGSVVQGVEKLWRLFRLRLMTEIRICRRRRLRLEMMSPFDSAIVLSF